MRKTITAAIAAALIIGCAPVAATTPTQAQARPAVLRPNLAKAFKQASILTLGDCLAYETSIEFGDKIVACHRPVPAPSCIAFSKPKIFCAMGFWLHNLSPAAELKWQNCSRFGYWARQRLQTVFIGPFEGWHCTAVQYGPPGTRPYPPKQAIAHR